MKRTVLILSAVLFTLIGCDGSEGSKRTNVSKQTILIPKKIPSGSKSLLSTLTNCDENRNWRWERCKGKVTGETKQYSITTFDGGSMFKVSGNVATELYTYNSATGKYIGASSGSATYKSNSGMEIKNILTVFPKEPNRWCFAWDWSIKDELKMTSTGRATLIQTNTHTCTKTCGIEDAEVQLLYNWMESVGAAATGTGGVTGILAAKKDCRIVSKIGSTKTETYELIFSD